ncbi:uncharacterized protein DFL_005845 [Arthrobotrys flagrans]|uniref:Uncharacterized protein n=1 Tax=Arthrobotrys flagrans TaxID=97331 RepID=A0A436ZZH1_ARTFL|nr:hypothetical protein DFL_005845 [Arthrobotrys flagrans]
MPRCHKLTYIDSRRIILRLLNNAFEEKGMLPSLNDPLITSEERKLVEQWDKEIVRLYADVAFLRRKGLVFTNIHTQVQHAKLSI